VRHRERRECEENKRNGSFSHGPPLPRAADLHGLIVTSKKPTDVFASPLVVPGKPG
jgi:hypothetical protein